MHLRTVPRQVHPGIALLLGLGWLTLAAWWGTERPWLCVALVFLGACWLVVGAASWRRTRTAADVSAL